MPATGQFSVFARMRVSPGQRDAVAELIREAAHAGGDDTGLLSYTVNAALDDPDLLWVTELWTDKSAHDATTRSEPVQRVTRAMRALLVGDPEGGYGHVLHAGA